MLRLSWSVYGNCGAKILHQRLYLVGGNAFADLLIDLLESFLLDPNLPAAGTDLGGDILEEIELITTSFLMVLVVERSSPPLTSCVIQMGRRYRKILCYDGRRGMPYSTWNRSLFSPPLLFSAHLDILDLEDPNGIRPQ